MRILKILERINSTRKLCLHRWQLNEIRMLKITDVETRIH